MEFQNVAIVHSGGDTPVSNAVLYALLCGLREGYFVPVCYLQGWENVSAGSYKSLNPEKLHDILNESGIIIGTSRENPLKQKGALEAIIQEFQRRNITWLVTLAGDDGIQVAVELNKRGMKCIHVSKSVDDDLSGTEITFGAWSARDLAAQATRNLRATTKSHRRVFFVQFMGRKSGKLTLYGGMAGGCHIILVPEFCDWTLDQLCLAIEFAHKQFGYVMVAVAEDLLQPELVKIKKAIYAKIGEPPLDPFGHPLLSKDTVSYAEILSNVVEGRTKIECRAQVLGHLCRSGPPCAYDVALAMNMGLEAADLIMNDKPSQVVVVRDGRVTSVPMEEIPLGVTRGLTEKEYRDWLRIAPVNFPII